MEYGIKEHFAKCKSQVSEISQKCTSLELRVETVQTCF